MAQKAEVMAVMMKIDVESLLWDDRQKEENQRKLPSFLSQSGLLLGVLVQYVNKWSLPYLKLLIRFLGLLKLMYQIRLVQCTTMHA